MSRRMSSDLGCRAESFRCMSASKSRRAFSRGAGEAVGSSTISARAVMVSWSCEQDRLLPHRSLVACADIGAPRHRIEGCASARAGPDVALLVKHAGKTKSEIRSESGVPFKKGEQHQAPRALPHSTRSTLRNVVLSCSAIAGEVDRLVVRCRTGTKRYGGRKRRSRGATPHAMHGTASKTLREVDDLNQTIDCNGKKRLATPLRIGQGNDRGRGAYVWSNGACRLSPSCARALGISYQLESRWILRGLQRCRRKSRGSDAPHVGPSTSDLKPPRGSAA